MCAALVVHADIIHLKALVTRLREAHIDAYGVRSFEAAREQLNRRSWDVLVVPVQLAAYNGLQLVHRARAMYPDITIILTGHGPDPAVESEARALQASYLADARLEEQAQHVVEKCGPLLTPGEAASSLRKTSV